MVVAASVPHRGSSPGPAPAASTSDGFGRAPGRVAEVRNALVPSLDAVHLKDDLHPKASAKGRYLPTEVVALLGQLGNRSYA